MRTKTDLFFAPVVNNRQKESPLDFAAKMLDALIAYNKSFMAQLLSGSQQEGIELILSLFVELSEIPPIADSSAKGNYNALKKCYIGNAVSDIKDYERIKSELNKGINLDSAYLNFFFLYTQTVEELKMSMSQSKMEVLLSHYFSPEHAKKKSKEIRGSKL